MRLPIPREKYPKGLFELAIGDVVGDVVVFGFACVSHVGGGRRRRFDCFVGGDIEGHSTRFVGREA